MAHSVVRLQTLELTAGCNQGVLKALKALAGTVYKDSF